jgi:uncharacterized protein YceH (UPF0502 family)
MGRKEVRYAHLLSGDIDLETLAIDEPVVLEIRADNERLTQLEHEVQMLRAELEGLKAQFAQFKEQFE